MLNMTYEHLVFRIVPPLLLRTERRRGWDTTAAALQWENAFTACCLLPRRASLPYYGGARYLFSAVSGHPALKCAEAQIHPTEVVLMTNRSHATYQIDSRSPRSRGNWPGGGRKNWRQWRRSGQRRQNDDVIWATNS